MKTKLPESINTVEEAKDFLQNLHNNGESYHPEDDAHDILWTGANPTPEECDQLNKLMSDIYENIDFYETGFDPCGFLLDLARKDGHI